MLNRSVVVLSPAKPYIEWASSLPGPAFDQHDEGDEVAYLLPPYESERQAQAVLQDVWPVLFEKELEAWYTDETAWPKDRDFATFQKWFKVEMHSMVVDLCADDLIDESLDDEDG